jgi:hypothetical protein
VARDYQENKALVIRGLRFGSGHTFSRVYIPLAGGQGQMKVFRKQGYDGSLPKLGNND